MIHKVFHLILLHALSLLDDIAYFIVILVLHRLIYKYFTHTHTQFDLY